MLDAAVRPVKQPHSLSMWIAVGPLFQDALVIEGEPVLVADAFENKINLEARWFPLTCLIEQDSHGNGAVFVVRDGKVTRVKIRVGKDSGLRVEVLSGLTEDDQVIAQITPSISEGTVVKPELAKAEEKKSPND